MRYPASSLSWNLLSFLKGGVLTLTRLWFLDLWVVIVERLELVDEWLGHGVNGSDTEWRNRDINIVQILDDRMVLLVINPIQRLDHHEVVLFLLVFLDHLLHWCKVLLVRQVYMIKQRTLAWQEWAGDFKGLCVPVFTLLLSVSRLKVGVLLHLQNKSDFSRVAKVCNSKVSYFLDKCFSSHFELIFAFFDKVSKFESLKLHDASNTKSRQIFTLIEIPQNIFHIKLQWLQVFVIFLLKIYQDIIFIVRHLISRLLKIGLRLATNWLHLVFTFLVRNHSLFYFSQDG